MIQLVVLDLATLLEDSGAVLERALALGAEAVGLPTDAIGHCLGLTARDAFERVSRRAARVDRPELRLDRAVLIYERVLERHYRQIGAVRAVTGTRAVIRSLRTHGKRIALTTTLPALTAERILHDTSWLAEDVFDAVVYARDVHHPRPRPDAIVEAMRRTGVLDPDAVMKVGETPADLAEGVLADCGAVVGATWGAFSRAELYLRPHTHLIDRMSHLAELVSRSELGLLSRSAESSHRPGWHA